MKSYATVNDIIKTGKNLTPAQTETAEILIETASSKLRLIASRYGKNIDKMIDDTETGEDFSNVKKHCYTGGLQSFEQLFRYSACYTGITVCVGIYCFNDISQCRAIPLFSEK